MQNLESSSALYGNLGVNVKRTFLLFLSASLLAACGRDRGSEYDPYSNQYAQLGYDDYSGLAGGGSSNGGGSALPAANSFGLQTIQGESSDGSLSSAQMQALQQYINDLDDQDKAQMNSVLLNNLRQCTFPPAAASTVAACRSGNGAACANTMSGYALGNILSGAKNMQFNGMTVALLNQLAAACAAVDLDSPQQVQQYIKQKSDSCKQGSKLGCGGLLMMIGRLFMKALALATGVLKAHGINL